MQEEQTKKTLLQKTEGLKQAYRGLEQYFGLQLPFVLSGADGSAKTVVRRAQLLISGYFKALLRQKKTFAQPQELYRYQFSKSVAPETVKLLGSYFKFHGTKKQEVIEKEILHSKNITQIYEQADKLAITPLLHFLDTSILDIFIEKNVLASIAKLDFEKFKTTLNAYLSGRLQQAVAPFTKDLMYFDWKNPVSIKWEARWARPISFSDEYISMSEGDSCKVHILENKKLKVIGVVKYQNGEKFLAFSFDGKRLATRLGNGTCKIYDLKAQKVIDTIKLYNSQINVFTFSFDGKYVAGCSGKTCKIYDLTTRKIVDTMQLGSVPIRVVLSPNNQYVAVALNDDVVTGLLYDISKGKTVVTIKQGNGERINYFAFSSDDKYLATASSSIEDGCGVYDIDKRELIKTFRSRHSSAERVVFSSDNRYLAMLWHGGEFKVYDLSMGSTIAQGDDVVDLVFSPDAKYRVTAERRSVVITSNAQQKVIKKISLLDRVDWFDVGASGKYFGVSWSGPWGGGYNIYSSNEDFVLKKLYAEAQLAASPAKKVFYDVLEFLLGDAW